MKSILDFIYSIVGISIIIGLFCILDFDGFIYMPLIQDYDNFVKANKCVFYDKIEFTF